MIFDDLVFSNKKISEFYCRSRKLNCSCVLQVIDILKILIRL